MSTYTETIGEKLNDLLEKTYDAEKGYKKAAENTEHPLLKPYFERRSKERTDFKQAIKKEIKQFDQNPETEGSLTGKVHRTWMDTKALFTADKAEAMLEESIRGEKSAVEEYKELLSDTHLPPSTAIMLKDQMNRIAYDLSTIKTLENLS